MALTARFLAFADNDTTSGAEKVLSAMMKVPDVSEYCFVGDGPYSSDATKWINMMKKYFNTPELVKKLRLSQGNHEHPESESQKAEDQIEAWLPHLKNSNDQLDWLSAGIVGNVYVIAGNTQDEDIEFKRDQYNWLASELQKAKQLRAAGTIDWIVYLAHKPFFTLKTNHSPYTAVRNNYKDIFRDAQVDFVIHGHNHNTQLWKPMIPNQSDANGEGTQLFSLMPDGKTFDFSKDHGACYIVSGHSGHEWNSIRNDQNNNVMHYRDSGLFGFTQIDFEGKKAIVKSIDSDGKVHYEYHVSREGSIVDPNPKPCPQSQCIDPVTKQCRTIGLNEQRDFVTGECIPIDLPPPPPPPPPTGSGIDQQAAMNFIRNSYKQSVQMLEEAPNFNRFWLWNDQLLGQIALKHIDQAMATTIENKMNSFNVTMKTPLATLDPKYRSNFSINSPSEPTVSTNPLIRYSDYSGSSPLSINDYADIAFLSCIHNYYLGNMTKAKEAYDAGRKFWDGQGMKDRGNITGDYAVYKVALGMLAEKITKFTPSIGIPENYFAPFQNKQNGGITTDKTNGQPSGSQNIETTALVLFALNPELLTDSTNPPPPPPPPDKDFTCPEGYWHFNEELGHCVPDLNPPNIPKCPEGYKWNSIKKICEKDGNTNPPPPPTGDPQAKLIAPSQVQAGQNVLLDASQSTNADTVTITQTIGQTVNLVDAGTFKKSFVAPNANNISLGFQAIAKKGTKTSITQVAIQIVTNNPPPPPPPPPPDGEFGFDSFGMKMLFKPTGKKVEMEEGTDHRNGKRYNVNHKYINYISQGYYKIGKGQEKINMKFDGPNHGSCKTISNFECLWYEPQIVLSDGSLNLGYEMPHPDNNPVDNSKLEYLTEPLGKIESGQWIGWAVAGYFDEQGFRNIKAFVDKNAFPNNDPNQKPLNNWVLALHAIEKGQIVTKPKQIVIPRKLPTDFDKGLENEVRMHRGTNGDTEMKNVWVMEIEPPQGTT